MKRVTFYASRRQSANQLHIETDGAVVNIEVGLHDAGGRLVTRVDVSPDGESRGGDGLGRFWVQDGPRIVRLHEGETALPGAADAAAAAARQQHIKDAAALNVIADYLRDPDYVNGLDLAVLVRSTGREVPDEDDGDSTS